MKRQSLCQCGTSWPSLSRICHCESCHSTFTGDKSFSAHRRGEHGVNRRCATPAEMAALGLAKNQKGRWHCPAGSKRGQGEPPKREPDVAA
jgi:hypothetical protein